MSKQNQKDNQKKNSQPGKSNKPRKPYTRKAGSNPPGNPNIKDIQQPRQSKYKTAEEIQKEIDAYFTECDKKNKPYTVTGLAIALGFTSRQAVINYENENKNKDIDGKEKSLMIDTIKKAKLIIEEYAERRLFDSKQVAGIIFNLKNNYGWIDRQDVQHGGDVILNVNGIKRI